MTRWVRNSALIMILTLFISLFSLFAILVVPLQNIGGGSVSSRSGSLVTAVTALDCGGHGEPSCNGICDSGLQLCDAPENDGLCYYCCEDVTDTCGDPPGAQLCQNSNPEGSYYDPDCTDQDLCIMNGTFWIEEDSWVSPKPSGYFACCDNNNDCVGHGGGQTGCNPYGYTFDMNPGESSICGDQNKILACTGLHNPGVNEKKVGTTVAGACCNGPYDDTWSSLNEWTTTPQSENSWSWTGYNSCLDGVDNDCDGLIDCYDPDCNNNTVCRPVCIDRDGDGYNITGGSCGPVDCDDTNASIHPGAVEECNNSLDDNCNGLIDGDDPVCQGEFCGDGVIQPGEQCDGNNWGPVQDCTSFDSYTGGALSCDPSTCLFDVSNCTGGNNTGTCGDGVINTGEQCDGNDWGPITGCADFDSFTGGALSCDPATCIFDTSACSVGCVDADGDGYNITGGSCGPVDCDDSNVSVHPGAVELCNGVDDDCDGLVDEDGVCDECQTNNDCQAIDCPSINGTLNGTCNNGFCNYDEPPFGCITECSDDVDNDGDGFIDYDGGGYGNAQADPGCTSFADDDETNGCYNDSDCVDVCPPNTPSEGWPWQGICIQGECHYNDSDCQVCHTYYYYYDYNNDGLLDGDDVSLLVSVVFGASCPGGYVCDLNNDGNVTSADVFTLANIISGSYNDGEICDDLIDNNCNGLIDGQDPDCQTGYFCSDTDGGVVPSLQGNVSVWGPTPSPPVYLFSDHCLDQETLIEYYCSPDNTSQNITLQCQYGCAEGACLPPGPNPVCGNGIIEPGETCDGNPPELGLQNRPWDWGPITGCSDFDNYTGGTLTCDPTTCHFNTELCAGGNNTGVCGDGVINTGETCDGSNWGNITGCSNFDSFTGGGLRCDETCHFDTSECGTSGNEYFCNDTDGGVVPLVYGETTSCPLFGEAPCFFHEDVCLDADTLEEGFCGVDGAIMTSNVLCAYGCVDGECLPQGPGELCGDGVIEPGEQCDFVNGEAIFGNLDCTDFDSFIGGSLGCNPTTCQAIVDNCTGGSQGICGDGVVNIGEQCDGTNFSSLDCTDFDSFTGGTLSCTSDCMANTSECTAGNLHYFCNDTDGGVVPSLQGNVSVWGPTPSPPVYLFSDHCLDQETLIEYYCSPDNTSQNITLQCQYGCAEGACLPPGPNPVCGNGIIEPGETCDGSNWGPITGCADFDNYTGGTLTCDPTTCHFNTELCTGGNNTGTCGDGVINTGETCDGSNWGNITGCTDFDSFTGGGLSCDNNCHFNTSDCTLPSGPYCGDGNIDPGEQCEIQNNWGSISGCSDFDNFTGGTLRCDLSTCTFNTSQCVAPQPFCGDGVIQPGEQCDGNNWGPVQDCTSFDSYTGGALSCDPTTCLFDVSNCTGGNNTGTCGDGVINTGEQCDGNDWGPITGCTDFDNFTGGVLSCDPETCLFDTGQCVAPQPFCGDGVIQPGEQCDGSNWGSITGCSDFDSYTGGALSCDPTTCLFDTSQCVGGNNTDVCGNGILESGEQCDGNDFSGQSCSSFGYNNGHLICTSSCTISTSGCYNSGGGGGGGGGHHGGGNGGGECINGYVKVNGACVKESEKSSPGINCDSDGDGYVRYAPSCIGKGRGTDCDDHDKTVHPGAPEICGNNKDDNCNGEVDEGCIIESPLSYNSQIRVPILSIVSYDVAVANLGNYDLDDVVVALDLPSNWQYDGPRKLGALRVGESRHVRFAILVSEDVNPTEHFTINVRDGKKIVATGNVTAQVEIPPFAVRIKPSLDNYKDEKGGDGEVYVFLNNREPKRFDNLEVELDVNEGRRTDYVQYLGVLSLEPYQRFRYRYTYPIDNLRDPEIVVGFLRQNGKIIAVSDDTLATVYHPTRFDKDARTLTQIGLQNQK